MGGRGGVFNRLVYGGGNGPLGGREVGILYFLLLARLRPDWLIKSLARQDPGIRSQEQHGLQIFTISTEDNSSRGDKKKQWYSSE